jgi:hypothetical protein
MILLSSLYRRIGEPQIDSRAKKIERADRLANIGALSVASADFVY